MPTKVLVFESDPGFAGELQSGLARLGCETRVVDDANAGLQVASSDRPDLILLSIELPRMNGFSVCNKLKRDPALKEVPLIIMSSDSTEETFEQHRRLRTRAEDYVHKPIAFDELLKRVRLFVSFDLDEVQPMSEDAIVIDDEIEIDESALYSDRPAASSGNGAQAAESVARDVESFAEQAFDALVDNTISERPVAASAEVPASVPPASNRVPTSAPPPPSSREASETAKLRDELASQKAHSDRLDQELRSAQTRIAELEDGASRGTAREAELTRLQRELEETKARFAAPGKGAGSAREFLDLREALNRKDKEILELRDQLTHRDKELLVLRDGSLNVEREKADLVDRSDDLERQLAEKTKANDALRADKEQANKRAEDFKRKSEKLVGDAEARQREIAELKEKYEARLAQANEELGRARSEAAAETEHAVASALEAAQAQAEQAQARSSGELRRQFEEGQRGLLANREAELRREFEGKLAAVERASNEARALLKAEHTQVLAEAEAAAQKRVDQLTMELRRGHDNAKRDLGSEHERALAALRAEHEENLRQLQQRHAAELARSGSDQQENEAAFEAAIEGLRLDLERRVEERDQALATGEEQAARIASLKAELGRVAGVETEMNELRRRLQGSEARLSALTRELSERTDERDGARNLIDERDAKIARLESELATTSGDAGQIRETLERERERLRKAHAKWQEDRTSLERAKDALAAALAQIEEAEERRLD
jgi:CheY-like chemotaxis protein